MFNCPSIDIEETSVFSQDNGLLLPKLFRHYEFLRDLFSRWSQAAIFVIREWWKCLQHTHTRPILPHPTPPHLKPTQPTLPHHHTHTQPNKTSLKFNAILSFAKNQFNKMHFKMLFARCWTLGLVRNGLLMLSDCVINTLSRHSWATSGTREPKFINSHQCWPAVYFAALWQPREEDSDWIGDIWLKNMAQFNGKVVLVTGEFAFGQPWGILQDLN